MKNLLAISVIALGITTASQANIIISEVYSTGSSSASAADWFELTNTGTSAVDITGWAVDDSSAAFGTARAFRGVTSIPAGASVIFAEANTAATNDAAVKTAFTDTWFGSSIPAGFTIGTYGGSGIGLSSDGDAVNIFNSSGTVVASVNFGAMTVGATLDNVAGIGSGNTISTLSVVGVNGAFAAVVGGDIGSPGVIAAAVPEPASLGIAAVGGLMALRRRRA